jgi:hypothetical protein
MCARARAAPPRVTGEPGERRTLAQDTTSLRTFLPGRRVRTSQSKRVSTRVCPSGSARATFALEVRRMREHASEGNTD